MYRPPWTVLSFAALTLTIPLSQSQVAAQAPSSDARVSVSHQGDDVTWSPCPDVDGCEIAVIRGELRNGPVDLFLRLDPGTVIPQIQHSVAERGLLLEGTLIRSDADGTVTTTLPGLYWYLPAGTIHGGLRCGDDAPCVTYESYAGTYDVVIIPGSPPLRF